MSDVARREGIEGEQAGHPLDGLPRITGRELGLGTLLRRERVRKAIGEGLRWLEEPLGGGITVGTAFVEDRAAGLQRPGVIARILWPGRGVRLGLGLETRLAHALVDRMLGYERPDGAERRQVTPVEWGVLTYVLARTLDGLAPLMDADDMVIDRVGPEPIDAEGMGPIVTLAWPVAVAEARVSGLARVWIPAGLLGLLEGEQASGGGLSRVPDEWRRRFGKLNSEWRAIAGTVRLPRGLTVLRKGFVIPLPGEMLQGRPGSLAGVIRLVAAGPGAADQIQARVTEGSGGGKVTVCGSLESLDPLMKEMVMSSASSENASRGSAGGGPGPSEMPVTLAVELGRVTIPLERLADLKEGDVLPLGRHSREPVELTSNGRVVARGELVLIDTELGVRVMNVLL